MILMNSDQRPAFGERNEWIGNDGYIWYTIKKRRQKRVWKSFLIGIGCALYGNGIVIDDNILHGWFEGQ